MPRYKIEIEYDGSSYFGWQKQKNGYTVQEAIEKALFAFTKEQVSIHGAGRTDAGVHAKGQVAHFDLIQEWSQTKIRAALNAHLQIQEEAISILESVLVPETFHARFSAKKRHYLYRILNRVSPPALETLRAWWVCKPLKIDAMQEAANLLLGQHDFTTFRSSFCQAKNPIRTLDRLEIIQKEAFLEIHVSAQSFLHRQVRSITGSLKTVGEGKWTAHDILRALEKKDRKACGPVAPACGLYLSHIDY